jgi:light-regulated signal transduction histidine kinase (bacteriophytochrome)
MSSYSTYESVVSRQAAPAVSVSLNEVWKQSLKKNEAAVKNSNVIVRCALLPQVNGQPQLLEKLFDSLVSLILSNPPSGSRLFLYVDCREEEEETKSSGAKNFILRFCANIIADEQWQRNSQLVLDECEAIVRLHNGGFAMNPIQSTGGLFVLSFNGKIDPCPQ